MNRAVYPGGDTVNFDSIAGGEEHDFGEIAGQFEAAPVATEPGSVNSQFFTQFDGGSFIAQACNKNLHKLG